MSLEEYPDSTDATTSSLEPQIADYLASVENDPASALQHIRSFFAGPEARLGSSELLKQLGWLGRLFDSSSGLSDHTWSALVADCGLVEMYTQLVQTCGFFDKRNSALTYVAFSGLAFLLMNWRTMSDVGTERSLLQHYPALFGAVWRNRDRIAHIFTGGLAPSNLANPILRCMSACAEQYRETLKFSAGMDTYLPSVAMFAWVCLRDDDMSAYVLQCLYDDTRPIPEDVLDQFVRDVVVGVVGVDAVLSRFEEELSRTCASDRQYLNVLVGAMTKLAKHPCLVSAVKERQTSLHVITWLRRRPRPGKPDAKDCLEAHAECLLTGSFMGMYATVQELARGLGVDHIITYFACGAWCMAQLAYLNDPSLRADWATHCSVYAKAILEIWRMRAQPWWTKAHTDAVVHWARAELMATLHALRVGQCSLRRPIKEYDELVDSWSTFSRMVGQTGVDRLCTYRLCPLAKPGVRPASLSTCKGCGRARYCGKECQRGDWKAHKRVCGKLLK